MNTSRIISLVTVATLFSSMSFAIAKEKKGGGGSNAGMAEYNKGNELFGQRQYEAAIAEFTKAIAANPNQAAYYENRGFAYIPLERAAEAINDFTKALELAPKDVRGYVGRAQAYTLHKDFDQAVADFDKAIELAPDEPSTYRLRGFADLGKNDYTAALQDFSKAIEKNPQDAQSYERRGYCNRSLRELRCGDRRLLEKPRAQPAGCPDLGAPRLHLHFFGQYDKAIADYQQAPQTRSE